MLARAGSIAALLSVSGEEIHTGCGHSTVGKVRSERRRPRRECRLYPCVFGAASLSLAVTVAMRGNESFPLIHLMYPHIVSTDILIQRSHLCVLPQAIRLCIWADELSHHLVFTKNDTAGKVRSRPWQLCLHRHILLAFVPFHERCPGVPRCRDDFHP
jgi:hypothetical protein